MGFPLPPDIFYLLADFSPDVRNLALDNEIYKIIKKVYGEREGKGNILLLEDDIKKARKELDWSLLSRYAVLTEDIIDKYSDKLNWDELSSNPVSN